MAADPDAETSTGTITSAYFVDLSVEEPDSEKCIVLYDAKSERLEMFPDDLKGAQAMLNSGTTRWLPGAAYSAYPYGNYKNPEYPYPMLRVHYGNWITPPLYSYGVVYYEVIDGNYEILQIVDMSDETENVGKGNYITTNSADNSGVITEAGYAVFYSGMTSPFTGADISADPIQGLTMSAECGAAFDGNNGNLPKSAANYKFYAVTNQGANAVTVRATDTILGTNETVVLIPGYAMTIGQTENNAENPYIIRTEAQLNNVQAAGYYKQTHDIAMSGNFAGVTSFAGSYNGNGLKLDAAKAGNGWMNGVSGTVTGLNLNLGALNASFFGDIGGTVSLNSLTIPSVGENGSLAKTVTGTLTLPAVTIGGNVDSVNGFLENVNGTLNCTGITVNGDVNGKLIGTVGSNAATDLSTINITGTVNGTVIGTVAGSLSNLTFTYSGDLPGTFVDTVSGSITLANDLTLNSVNTLFGTVSGSVTAKNITVSSVSGKLVGSVSGSMTTGAVTVNNDETALTTKLFVAVSGNLNTGAVSVGAIGANGAVVGESSGTVTTQAITTGTVAENGMVFGGMKNVTTGAISTGAVAGQIFGDVSGEVKTGNITLVAVEKVPVETEPTSEPAESTEPTETTEPQYEEKEVLQALSGRIFGKVTGTVTTGKISTGDVSGKLLEEAAGNVTLGGIKTGAANNSLITKLTSGTVTTGEIEVASLGAPLVAAFDGGTLQGGAEAPAAILVQDSAANGFLFSEITAGAVNNYTITLNTLGAGLTHELSGTMNNVSLTVNGDLAVDVINKFTNTTTALDGLTVTVNGNMSANLIESAAGTVKNLTLTVSGDLSGNALGTVGDVTTLNLTVNGTLKASAIGTAGGSLSGVTVKAGTVEVTTAGDFGVITAQLASGKTLSGSSVTVDNVMNITVGANGSIGGLVGVNNGTISGSTVTGALNITAGESSAVNVGGLAGSSSGTMTLSTQSNVTVNYVQSTGDSANIGGIVGLMNGGSLNGTANTTVISGAINLTGTASGRNYVVGGAVGYAGNVTVENVAASMILGAEWLNAANETESMAFVDSIANVGPVGMFVGYTNNGSFTNCFSVAENAAFQFLGQTEIATVDFTEEIWTASVSGTLLKAYSDIMDANGNPALFEVTDAQGNVTKYDPEKAEAIAQIANQYTRVSVALDGCYFYWNGVLQEQNYVKNAVYYTCEQYEQKQYFAAESLIVSLSTTVTEKVTEDDTTRYDTGKYYLKDNVYYRAYVQYKQEGSIFNRTYKVYIYNSLSSDAAVLDSITADRDSIISDRYANITLHQLTRPQLSSGNYLVVADNRAYGKDANEDFMSVFEERDSMYSKIWVCDGATLSMSGTSVVPAINGMDAASYTSESFEATYTIDALGLTNAKLYPLSEGAAEYRLLEYTQITGEDYERQKLTYEAAPADVVIPATVATTSLEDEANLPGETGEVPEGTEPTEVTEPVTEPGTNE